MDRPFEILEHPADLGIKATGATLPEAFENAAKGLLSVMAGHGAVEGSQRRTVKLTAADTGQLLVRWLSEVLYLFDAERFVPSTFQFVEFSDTSLSAEMTGGPFDAIGHQATLDVKAITYHQLRIDQRHGRWQVTVFVDI